MGFARYACIRIATMFGVLLVTMLLTVALVGSGMDTILRQSIEQQVRLELGQNPAVAAGFDDPAQYEEFAAQQARDRIEAFGLDEPWHSPGRIGQSMYRILILDFGNAAFLTSDAGSSSVADILLEKLPRTILLFTTATAAISAAGILLGAAAAARAGSGVDRATSGLAVLGSSFPVWWVGLLMIFLFAFAWKVFPARATPTVGPDDPGYIADLLYHMILPLATIVLVGFGSWAYLVRNFMSGILREDHVWARRTAGIPERAIVYRHALRNAAPPIITVLALSLSGSLGGAIITEAVFDWPGMGRLYFEAITVLDLPVIVGATYVLTAFFLASIFAADILYGYFDPRVRRSGA